MELPKDPAISIEDYLAMEPEEGVRYEWVEGAIYAMSGGTPRHAAVISNVLIELGGQLRGSGCRATSADQRVHCEMTRSYLYPDVTVVCGPYELASDGLSVRNPAVVVEVLSPSTATHDLVRKFDHYRRIPTLQCVLYVQPDDPYVVCFRRDGARWIREDYTDGAVPLHPEGIELTFPAIYADLDVIP